ncbi:hypothetical protein [Actinomadura oligospora]|uniref:hypothetical protein n=1 Tax=Actinomadura oligospora TaxID=111804 RepID=UPI00047A2C39|nr:hypothetical protein [Actinomadura oligospora]
MKLRFVFTVEIDQERLWQVERDQQREWLATEIAAGIEEATAVRELDGQITWHHVGGPRLPATVATAMLNRCPIRHQMSVDSDGAWG